jgi:hypothetical protein
MADGYQNMAFHSFSKYIKYKEYSNVKREPGFQYPNTFWSAVTTITICANHNSKVYVAPVTPVTVPPSQGERPESKNQYSAYAITLYQR